MYILNITRVNNINRSKESFIEEHSDIFTGLGSFPDTYAITLKPDAQSKINSSRRIPLILKDRVKDTLDRMVNNGIIKPTDDNVLPEWVSSIVIVEKPGKSLRICLDPQILNQSIVRNYYSIPTADEIKARLSHKKFYTVLDIKDGFYHVCKTRSPFK